MGFIASYKQLEKLCNELFEVDRQGVGEYIDEMYSISDGKDYVADWYDVLHRLKYCRRLRNKIVHEPEYDEESSCEPEDTEWLESFRMRVLSQTDPLALYHRATAPKPVQAQVESDPRNSISSNGILIFLIIALSLLGFSLLAAALYISGR